MKWLTTIELLETDGIPRQRHLIPLDLTIPAQQALLLDFIRETMEVGLSNVLNPKHEIRLKVWTRTTNLDPMILEEISTRSGCLKTGQQPEQSNLPSDCLQTPQESASLPSSPCSLPESQKPDEASSPRRSRSKPSKRASQSS